MSQAVTQALVKELFDYDPITGVFINRKRRAGVAFGEQAGSIDSHGYRQIKIQGVLYLEHRLAWLWVHGVWPSCQIDHINRNRADNRLNNLRLAPNNELDNLQNVGLRPSNRSGVAGVCWIRRLSKWEVQIQHNKKKRYIGVFSSLLDAVAARYAAEKKYFTYSNN